MRYLAWVRTWRPSLVLSLWAMAAALCDGALRLGSWTQTQSHIHGPGLEIDDAITSDQSFAMNGIQILGIDAYRNDASYAPAWRYFTILAECHFSGTFPYLVCVNDHGTATPTGEGYYRNTIIYESE